MKDALGNDIVIGRKYGYSSSQGSRISIVTGFADKITDRCVTINITSRQNFLYGEPTPWYGGDRKKVSVTSCILFPVVNVHDITDATFSGQATGIELGKAMAIDMIEAAPFRAIAREADELAFKIVKDLRGDDA